jgi:hypothetical protein
MVHPPASRATAELANLLSSIRNQAETESLSRYGINNLFGPTDSQEVLTDFEEGENVSDIGVRTVMAEMMNAGSLPKTGPSTIYMIFLEPGLRATLGTLTGRKHYLAYHHFFNIAGQRLHYVVVPYQPDVNTAKAIALRALVVAALNPIGEVGN